MHKLSFILISVFLSTTVVMADTGIISQKSANSVKITADRLEKILISKGMTVFIRINHSAGAKKVGKKLRPTELIIFGNPKVGTPLMQCQQTVALDLPQKALIWEDESSQVWFSYNDPAYLLKRHDIKGCDKITQKITNALANFSQAAIQ